MAVTIVFDGMEHTIEGLTWTGPEADMLNEFSESFAASLGGEVPWHDYAIAERMVELTGGKIVKAEHEPWVDGRVY